MSGCIGCSCTRPSAAQDRGRLLLATRVSHSLDALRTVVDAAGATAVERAPGLLEVSTPDAAGLLAAALRGLSSVEAAEVRAVQLGAEDGDALLAAALAAPSLLQLAARAEHADLLPLFADERGAFRSVYQPIVALDDADHRVVGHEALLRATGPSGPVMPQALFSAAEEAGWLHVLDRVGRTTALRGAAGWLGDDLLFVNFLPTTIYRPQVCLRTTEKAADLAGLRLDQLVFEVTESERITDLEHLSDVFAYYRERGCKVALDDLGAGYSSLNMLVQLQPDVVKLDKEIVQRLPERAATAVITAVVDITHAYGGLVLAECVETAEQASVALDLGVDLGQGWYFGKPVDRSTDTRAPGATPPAHRPAPRPVADRAVALSAAAAFTGDDAAVALPAPAAPTAPTVPVVHALPAAGPAPVRAVVRGSADVEALLARAVQVSSAGVSIADATALDMPLIYVNDAFEEATGYTSVEALGRNCRFLQGPGTDPDAVRGLREAVRAGRDHVVVLRNYRKDGRPWWNELRMSPVQDDRGRVTHYFGFQNDVTARVDAEHEVTRLVHLDPLTELPNRAHLLTSLREQSERAALDGSTFAVLFLDLDGFKAVNDRLGHAIGDLTLAAVAACLRGALRKVDVLARYGGDEFVAILADIAPDEVQRVAQRTADAVLGSLTNPLHVAGEVVQLGASVGVALHPRDGRTPEQLLLAADRAVYAAKQSGRGRAVLAGSYPPSAG